MLDTVRLTTYSGSRLGLQFMPEFSLFWQESSAHPILPFKAETRPWLSVSFRHAFYAGKLTVLFVLLLHLLTLVTRF